MEIKAVDPEFVRVWSRVKGGRPQQEQPRQDDAEEFILGKLRSELERRRCYLALGLTASAQKSLLRARKLRTAWFICSGEQVWPRDLGAREPFPSRSEGLRQLYLAEELSEQDYLAAREGSSGEMLREVFAQCAQLCRKTRQELWQEMEHVPGR